MQAGHRRRCRPIPTSTADGKGKSVGLLFDVTGRGDKSFNDAAAAGLDKAKTDFGVTGHESTPTAADGSDRPERIKAFVGNNDLIVAVGFLWGDAVTASAAQNPNQKYAIIDSIVVTIGPPASHHHAARTSGRWCSRANQGSFLVGAAAACASKTGKIGFIGGVENDPLIKNFEVGFTAGVKQVNPDATVEVKYITQPPDFTGFNDPAKGKAIAKAMYDSGHRRRLRRRRWLRQGPVRGRRRDAARSRARSTPSASTRTSTSRRRPSQQPYILTSALKRVDVATYEAIADELNGKLTGEIKTYDLQEQRRRLRGSATRTSTSTPARSRS